MNVRAEYADKEQAAWRSFMDAVERVPAERLEEPGVVPGWSVKDLITHNGGWARYAGEYLDGLREGAFSDPFEGVDDSHWDEMSQKMVEESKGLTIEQVLATAEEDRAFARETWASLPHIGEQAAQFFADETFLHYPDHTGEIERWLSEE